MTDPIEAVARAITDANINPWDELLPQQEREALRRLTEARRIEARAAIAAFLDAVREPRQVPADLGAHEVWVGSETNLSDRALAVTVWQAMIDALREELLRVVP